MKTQIQQTRASLLRGGRMTRHKGQVASFAPAPGRSLSGVSVAAVGAALVFGGGAAWGGSCVDQGGGAFVCSGPANDITPEGTILIDEPASPTTITTEPGFGVNAAGDAIRVSDAGRVTFTDANGARITGGNDGIDIRADAGISITATGRVSGGESGIIARNNGSGALTIEVADVSAANAEGISAENNGTDLSVTATGAVQSESDGIFAINRGTGALTIDVVDITSTDGEGIDASNRSAGSDLSITSTGHIETAHTALLAVNEGRGAVRVDVADVTSTGFYGISTFNASQGTDLSITASGRVLSDELAVYASNFGSGALTIDLADIRSENGGGIHAQNYGTDLSITASGPIGAERKGIIAGNNGYGALTIDVTDVTSATGGGIEAINRTRGTDLSITASGTVSAYRRAIYASNDGIGSLSIDVNTVQSTGGYGIEAFNDNELFSDLSIDASGHVSGVGGIFADQGNIGVLRIDVADVTGTERNGILAENAGTDLSITSSGTVTGGKSGILASHKGSGALTITATNAFGEYGHGVFARGEGTDISITTSGNIGGLNGGIAALNYGTGVTDVTVSGTVDSTNGPVIQAASLSTSTIDLCDGAVVTPDSGQAIINGDDDGTVILRDGARLSGSIAMNGGDDRLIIEGGADIGGATAFDGGAGFGDALIFSGFTGIFDSAAFTDWESLAAQDGGTVRLVGAHAGTIGTITVGSETEIVLDSAGFALNGGMQIEAAGRVVAGAGGSGRVSFAGTVSNDGLITTADGASGDTLSFAVGLTGNGAIGLDVNLGDGTSDAVFVAGDTAGASQGIDVTATGTTVDEAQVFTLVTVAGHSTASDFRLVNAGFVTNDGVQAISDGEVAYLLQHDEAAGTFVLNPFDAGEILFSPGGVFVAAGVEQFSRYLNFGSALARVRGASQDGDAAAQTVSRALHDVATTSGPHVWVQASGQSGSYSVEGRDVETVSTALRFGAAMPLADIGAGRLVGGVGFGLGRLSSNLETDLTRAAIDTDARDLTLSLLWIAQNHLYTDIQLRYAAFDTTITPNGGAAVDASGHGYGVSLEIGKPFELRNGLALIPQAQIMYGEVDIDDVANLAGEGAVVSRDDGDRVTARLGLRAEHRLAGKAMLFGQIDYFHAFDTTTSVVSGAIPTVTERDRNSAALTLGGHVAISQNASLFGEITGATSLGGKHSDRRLGGSLGLEVRF